MYTEGRKTMYTERDFVKAIMVKPGDYHFNREFIDLVSDGVKRGIVTFDKLKAISMDADEQIKRGEKRWRWQVFSDELRPIFPKWPRFSKDNKEPPPPTKEESARILKELDNQPFRRSDEPVPRIPENPQVRCYYDFNRLDESKRKEVIGWMNDFLKKVGGVENAREKAITNIVQHNNLSAAAKGLEYLKEILLPKASKALDRILSALEPARIQEPIEPVEDTSNDDPPTGPQTP